LYYTICHLYSHSPTPEFILICLNNIAMSDHAACFDQERCWSSIPHRKSWLDLLNATNVILTSKPNQTPPVSDPSSPTGNVLSGLHINSSREEIPILFNGSSLLSVKSLSTCSLDQLDINYDSGLINHQTNSNYFATCIRNNSPNYLQYFNAAYIRKLCSVPTPDFTRPPPQVGLKFENCHFNVTHLHNAQLTDYKQAKPVANLHYFCQYFN
jgi:hypothetical protein